MNQRFDVYDQVRQDYQQILLNPQNSILTGDTDNSTVSASVGYTPEELAQVPAESNLGLGCGNPLRAANLKVGKRSLTWAAARALTASCPVCR